MTLPNTIVDFEGAPRRITKDKREFVYCVTRQPIDAEQFPQVRTRFSVEKFSEDDPIKDLPIETYFVTLYYRDRVSHAELSCFCSCPGFNIQKYSKLQHKHVIMVNMFELSGVGDGESLYYKLDNKNNVSSWSPS